MAATVSNTATIFALYGMSSSSERYEPYTSVPQPATDRLKNAWPSANSQTMGSASPAGSRTNMYW